MTSEEREAQMRAALAAIGDGRTEIFADAVELKAAALADDGKPKLPTFTMLAYSGGLLRVAGWPYPVLVELSGMALHREPMAMLKDHDPTDPVGHSTEVVNDARKVRIDGVVSGVGQAAKDVVGAAANGFRWSASVGVSPVKAIFVPEEQSVKANGREFPGPCYYFPKSVLMETSFLAVGADNKAVVKIAAQAIPFSRGGREMKTFEEWLKAKGLTLTDENKVELKAQYDAEVKAASPAEPPPQAPPATPPVQASAPADPVASMRAAAAAEASRIEAIGKIEGIADQPAIRATAIGEGWTVDKATLEVLRASRPAAPAIHVTGKPVTAEVLEAAALMGFGFGAEKVVKAFGAPVAEMAHRLRGMGLKQLIQACCAMEGRRFDALGASENECIQAAFSTISMPNILTSSANKVLADSYAAVPSVARRLFGRLSAKNFQTITGYRVTGRQAMQDLTPGGELKHVTMGEESAFSYRVGTKGSLLGIKREDLVNDDLGAFLNVPSLVGQGGAIALEEDSATLVLAAIDVIFTAGNLNLITGAGSALGLAGLGVAEQALADQKDADGKPIFVTGRFLLVPTALTGTAEELYKFQQIVAAASASARPNGNRFMGKYEPLTWPYLSNAAFHAKASSTGWGLFADPAYAATFAMAFLNGQEQPVVEEVATPSQFLGRTWRAYFDYGVCVRDKRTGVWSKGV